MPIGGLAVAGMPAQNKSGRSRKISRSKILDPFHDALGIGQIVVDAKEIL